MEDLEKYLLPTEVIKSDSKVLIDFAEQAAAGALPPAQIASRLFLAVRDKIIYDPYSPFYHNSFYTPDFVLQRESCINSLEQVL